MAECLHVAGMFFPNKTDIYIYIYKMAEGEYDDCVEDYKNNHDDNEQEASRTQPFFPFHSSTPYHVGEHVEMQTMQHEKTGLPSYEGTSFGGEKTPLLIDLETRLDKLKRNSLTGILDISGNLAGENILSLEEQKEQIEKAKQFIKVPSRFFKNGADRFF